MLRNVLLGVAAIYVVVSLFLLFSLRSRVQGLEQKQQTLEASDKELRDKLHMTTKTMSESVQALGSKVGMTQEEIEAPHRGTAPATAAGRGQADGGAEKNPATGLAGFR